MWIKAFVLKSCRSISSRLTLAAIRFLHDQVLVDIIRWLTFTGITWVVSTKVNFFANLIFVFCSYSLCFLSDLSIFSIGLFSIENSNKVANPTVTTMANKVSGATQNCAFALFAHNLCVHSQCARSLKMYCTLKAVPAVFLAICSGSIFFSFRRRSAAEFFFSSDNSREKVLRGYLFSVWRHSNRVKWDCGNDVQLKRIAWGGWFARTAYSMRV